MKIILLGKTPRLLYKRRLLRRQLILILSFILLFILLMTLSGCSTARLMRPRVTPRYYQQILNTATLGLIPDESVTYSESTCVTLSTMNLEKTLKQDPVKVLGELRHLAQSTGSPQFLSALVEIAYNEGRLKQKYHPQEASDYFLAGAVYAYIYLFHENYASERNPYDPIFGNVCTWYNLSVENLLRLTAENGMLTSPRNGMVPLNISDKKSCVAVLNAKKWTFKDISAFAFCSEFEITGLRNRYRSYGVGVPLIACYDADIKRTSAYHYCPERLTFPCTVILRPSADMMEELLLHSQASVRKLVSMRPDMIGLEFHDTLHHSRMKVADGIAPLEIDYSTPVAFSMDGEDVLQLRTTGFFTPDKLTELNESGTREIRGMYMASPYDPNKIPVIMVHGLFSSPFTWMEMYNTLNGISAIREKYQFWFYFYPNGLPYWVSAAQLRQDMRQVREKIDPEYDDLNLNRMVLIGHSMGGLISYMQTINSGEIFWNLISDIPVMETDGSTEVKSTLNEWFHTTQNPSVTDVITLGTPFHGSVYANSFTQRLARMTSNPASMVKKSLTQYTTANHKNIKDTTLLQLKNSIETLDAKCPLFKSLMEAPRAPWVKYHNIIGTGENGVKAIMKRGAQASSASASTTDVLVGSDGFVTVSSAALPGATTEMLIPFEHQHATNHPQVILEVARILAGKDARELLGSEDNPVQTP